MLRKITRALDRAAAALELRYARTVCHRVTPGQLRLYADLGGYEPLTYLLDPDANWMPEQLPFVGLAGLAFTFRDADGRLHETVALPDGSRFELFEPVTADELLAAWDLR